MTTNCERRTPAILPVDAGETAIDSALCDVADDFDTPHVMAPDQVALMAQRIVQRGTGRSAERQHTNRRLRNASAVSLVAHAVMGVAAATMVLSQPEEVDRRDALLTLELAGTTSDRPATDGIELSRDDADETVTMADELRVPADQAALAEAENERAREREHGQEAGQETEPVQFARADVEPSRNHLQNADPIAPIPSLAGWIAGTPVGHARWPSADSADRREAQPTSGKAKVPQADNGAATLAKGGGGGASFAGASTESAQHVVYVVDASGPMVTSMPMVLEELLRSVWRLSDAQSFNVVLFRESRSGSEDRSERFATSLLPATEQNKRALARWLSGTRPEGRSNPLTGLELGLSYDADVVFLLSRSVERSAGGVWGDGLTATMDRLERLNPTVKADGRAVQIQSIAFLEDDPTGLLRAIAEQHGPRDGSGYRVVRAAEDLGDPPVR